MVSFCVQVSDGIPPLPSAFRGRSVRRSRARECMTRTPSGRSRRTTREVICVPEAALQGTFFAVPRRNRREMLASHGLLGRCSFETNWAREAIEAEVASLFDAHVQPGPFEFEWLQVYKFCRLHPFSNIDTCMCSKSFN